MKSRSVFVLLALAGVIMAGSPVAARTDSTEPDPGGWNYTVAPYLWAAGIDGTLTINRIQAGVDVPFSDILNDLDFAGMLHFDMQSDRWVVSSDLIYVDLDADADVLFGTVSASVTQTLFEVAGGYRVSPVVIVLAGARWVDLDGGLRYQGQFVEEKLDESRSWIDPFVGVHLAVPLAKRWRLGIHGDIGGFGVGSDLAWQAYADVGFRASDLISVIVGYRAIDMDYEHGGGDDLFGYDMLIAGPQLGVAFHF